MKKKQLTPEQTAVAAARVGQLSLSIAQLRNNQFQSLTEAAVFCAAAAKDANGSPGTLGDVAASS